MPEKLFNKAEKLRYLSKYETSLQYYRKALNSYKKADNTEGMLYCLIAMADVQRMLGRYTASLKSYVSAYELTKILRKPALRADTEVGMGLCLRGMGLWKDALKLFRKAKGFYKRTDDIEGIAFILWAEAGAYRYGGQPLKAIDLLKEALEINEQLEDLESQGYCLNALGGASRVAGLYNESLRYYKKANRIFEITGDRFGKAYSYCGIGNALRMKGKYDEAMDYFKNALNIYKRIGDIVSSAYTLWSIGQTYTMLSRPAMALRYYQRAFKQFKKTGDHRGRVYYLLGLAQCSIQHNDMKKVKQLLCKAKELAEYYDFRLELCHCDAISLLLENKKTDCYQRLGLVYRAKSLPLNIP